MASVRRAVGIAGVVLAAGLSMLTLGAGAPAPATRPAAAGNAAAPSTRPAASSSSADPAASSPDLMLKQLLSGNRPKPALEPVEFEPEGRPDAPVARPGAPVRTGGGSDGESYAVIREGTYLVDRVGRLTRTPDGQQELTLEADGSGLKDPPLILLPNQKLMLMERYVRNSSRDLKFRITGMVTEYHGRNYILLEKMVVVDAGALSPVQQNPALRRR